MPNFNKITNTENEFKKEDIYSVYNSYDPDSEKPWYFEHVDKEKCKSVLMSLKSAYKDCTFLIRRDDLSSSEFNTYLM
jgi:hypothetical protein